MNNFESNFPEAEEPVPTNKDSSTHPEGARVVHLEIQDEVAKNREAIEKVQQKIIKFKKEMNEKKKDDGTKRAA